MAEQLVLPLLVTMAARVPGNTEARYINRVYAAVLSTQPYFALARACHDFLTGRAGDGHWRPEPGAIFQRAERHARPYREELAQISEVLEFANWRRSETEPDKGRVAALMRDVADEMKAFRSHEKRESDAQAVSDFETELAAKYRDKPLPKLSVEMRVILGLGIPKIEE